MLVLGGVIENYTDPQNPLNNYSIPADHLDLYDPSNSTFSQLGGAQFMRRVDEYPYTYVLPEAITSNGVVFPAGSVFMSGPRTNTAVLDWTVPRWSADILRSFFYYNHASSVMYLPGKIMQCGGGTSGQGNATADYETIDMTAAGSHQWPTQLKYMPRARRNHNLVILPDGTVLCIGGNEVGNSGPNAQPVTVTDHWDPIADVWTEMQLASESAAMLGRWYHSTAMLLPDGRVLVAGGDTLPSMQIFTPPNIYSPPGTSLVRPAITSGPTELQYGQQATFGVNLPHGMPFAGVSLIKLGSVTHGFDQDQRYLDNLQPSLVGTNLTITMPGASWAPPGYYMFFVLAENGDYKLPSIGRYVKVGN